MRRSITAIVLGFVCALPFFTLSVAPAHAQKIGDWCLLERPRTVGQGDDISQPFGGRSRLEHTVVLYEEMAGAGPGWMIMSCFPTQGPALVALSAFSAGDMPATWCVMSCPTKIDAAGRKMPKRFTAILCRDIAWAPTMVSDGWTTDVSNITFTAAMGIVTTGDPAFPPGSPPGDCIGSGSNACYSTDGSCGQNLSNTASNSGGGGGGGPMQQGGGGGGEGQPGGGGGPQGGGQGGGGGNPPPAIIPIPDPQFNPPQPPIQKASNDPNTPPMSGPGNPPPMGGQPPANQPPMTPPQGGTRGPGPTGGKLPGFQSHNLSEPFKPGGQCPMAVSNPAAGPTQTAFESCTWDDPKQGGKDGWVGCVREQNANFVCKASNAPPVCKCTQDWSGKVPPADELAKLAPGSGRGEWQIKEMTDEEAKMFGAGSAAYAPSDNTKMAGLGPPPNPPDNNPMGGLGPPADPPKNNPPAPGGTAAAPPQGPIFIPIPVTPPAPPPAPPAGPPSKPKGPCDQTPPGSTTNSGTPPGTHTGGNTGPGTKIVDTFDPPKKPGDKPPGTATINSGTCTLPDAKTGLKTCTDTQGRTCTTKGPDFCNPAETAQAPPPPSGPLNLKQKPGTQVASKEDPKVDPSSVPACESKAPYLPWGGTGSATITVSGGKPCGVGWHDTGATVLDSMSVTSHPAHGTLTPRDQHMIIFTPTPGYKGKDSFMLSMQESNRGRRATLRVKVSVTIQ